jgi:hypothetical protein
MAPPALYWKLASDKAAEFATIETVPRDETRLVVISRPNWNILFSMPFGTPMCKIDLMMEKSG